MISMLRRRRDEKAVDGSDWSGCHLRGSLAAQKPTTYSGVIMDSQCAMVGSHDKMIDSGRMKNIQDCTLQCVKNGATFVLYDSNTKLVYQLDNQKKAKSFPAYKVFITGILNEATMAIHVKDIEMAPNGKPKPGW